MNPLESGDMWLCMGCLRKLYMEIGVGSRVEAKKWVGRMVKGFRKNKWIGPAKKGRKILTALTSMDRPIAKDSQQ